MNTIRCGAFAALLTGTGALAATDNFDQATLGSLPAGWTSAQTGSGTAKWTVEPDASAPSSPHVLRQGGAADYPVCLNTESALKDGVVETKLKIVSGAKNQAGGVIWRSKDPDNYYVCRASVTDGDVVFWKMVAGKRSRIEPADGKGREVTKVAIAAGEWHSLRVEISGSRFAVIFDGRKLYEVEDTTFTNAGKVGLWTKDDSVTLFDDFTYAAK